MVPPFEKCHAYCVYVVFLQPRYFPTQLQKFLYQIHCSSRKPNWCGVEKCFFWHISRYLIKHLNSIVYVAKCFQQEKKTFNGYCGMFAGFNAYANLCSFWGMTYEYNILLEIIPQVAPYPLPEPHRPKIHESLACRLDHTYPSSNRLPQAHGVTRCL